MAEALRAILRRSGLPYEPYTEARRQAEGEQARQVSLAQASQ